jgi:hypothetical protein
MVLTRTGVWEGWFARKDILSYPWVAFRHPTGGNHFGEAHTMNVVQSPTFLDRRGTRPAGLEETRVERRQFGDSRDSFDPEVREVAEAIDAYKLTYQRRYITLAEVVEVIKSLGYHK